MINYLSKNLHLSNFINKNGLQYFMSTKGRKIEEVGFRTEDIINTR